MRLKRVKDTREAAVRHVEIELAALTDAARAVELAANEARAAWSRAMQVTVSEYCSSEELGEALDYAHTLGLRFEAHARAVNEAADRRDACRARLTAARIEVRKLEIWGERVREAEALDETTRERRTGDELAARIRRNA